MTLQRTLSIIKPDAVAEGFLGKILARLEEKGFKIVALKRSHLRPEQVEAFYHVHRERGFFKELVSFMSSGPVVLAVLEAENAVALYRDLMGTTDPKKASPGTLRADFAKSIDANAVHGSDSLETAAVEIQMMFPDEIFPEESSAK